LISNIWPEMFQPGFDKQNETRRKKSSFKKRNETKLTFYSYFVQLKLTVKHKALAHRSGSQGWTGHSSMRCWSQGLLHPIQNV
jgi:hypothetical protein